MKKNKVVYLAYVSNESGAGEYAGSNTSLSGLKTDVRSRYGAGWTVKIEKIENDIGPFEVARFTIRK